MAHGLGCAGGVLADDAGALEAGSDAPSEAGADARVGVDDAAADGGDGATDGAPDPTDAGDADGAAIDATSEASSDGGVAVPCIPTLSNIHTADFHVSFHVKTTQTSLAALVSQRSVCIHGMFWDIRMGANGKVAVETDDGTSYTAFASTAPVNDGQPHHVVVARTSGVILVTIDDAPSGSAASLASFDALAPLSSGTEVCVGADGTAAFVGALTELCLTSP